MPLNIGFSGIILLVFIALLFFGPSKLPQLGKAIGTTIREFRSGTRELVEEIEVNNNEKNK
ncbi:twin-arginine translocase TatA/TatE family subunit [Cohnella abietis]|uniref:Sec-independent protein translocase protein TatA n=1 Tax=Cohnella abietis TaxID=2507935 RepID=A0A3T1D832_9BACL|nr:twin-arginine translocase TatA/TatE family subunit [Cohnella abietis]BBI34242.1 hypothetical protein KCTCHS21_36410 [Cohnella abietis]